MGQKVINGDVNITGSVKKNGAEVTTKIIETTYAALVTCINNSTLIPGQQYRITDYVCTTVQENTRSAGHPFDIIVVADAVNRLNENARAIRHDGDTYFANSKLEAWQVWYSLDNDTSRFAWADALNGKGVVYRMIDEWGNDCPYDFKNIKFLRDGLYYYTFTVYDDDDTKDIVDVSTIQNRFKNDENGYSAVFNNKINEWKSGTYDETGDSCDYKSTKLNDIVFISKTSYDLVFYGIKSNTFGINCYSNTFGNSCNSNTFGNECYHNTFGNECTFNTFGNKCLSNTFGNDCTFNTFGNECLSNTFGNSCHSNTFGNECYYNKITGDNVKYISVDNGIQGASSANKFDLYDPAILNKNYQVTFKKSASGKYLMLWANDNGTMTGKIKATNTTPTWSNIV